MESANSFYDGCFLEALKLPWIDLSNHDSMGRSTFSPNMALTNTPLISGSFMKHILYGSFGSLVEAPFVRTPN